MTEVASRDLRNSTRSLLDRVEAGETLTITVDGRPVALLAPVPRRRRWTSRVEFVALVESSRADAALTTDLEALAGEMTDEHPLT